MVPNQGSTEKIIILILVLLLKYLILLKKNFPRGFSQELFQVVLKYPGKVHFITMKEFILKIIFEFWLTSLLILLFQLNMHLLVFLVPTLGEYSLCRYLDTTSQWWNFVLLFNVVSSLKIFSNKLMALSLLLSIFGEYEPC